MSDTKYMGEFKEEAETETAKDFSLSEQSAREVPATVDEDDLIGDEDDLVEGTSITIKEFKELKAKYPNSRFVYVEYFGKPIILRSLVWKDVEDMNAALAKVMNQIIEDNRKQIKLKEPKITDEDLERRLSQVKMDPIIQHYWHLKFSLVLSKEDILAKMMEKTIDAGLPVALIDLSNRASGFSQLDATLMNEEV